MRNTPSWSSFGCGFILNMCAATVFVCSDLSMYNILLRACRPCKYFSDEHVWWFDSRRTYNNNGQQKQFTDKPRARASFCKQFSIKMVSILDYSKSVCIAFYGTKGLKVQNKSTLLSLLLCICSNPMSSWIRRGPPCKSKRWPTFEPQVSDSLQMPSYLCVFSLTRWSTPSFTLVVCCVYCVYFNRK